MTPDRWRRVEKVFAAAVDLDPGSRPAFLEEACRSDPALKREVDSLLSALAENSTDFLESPAMEVVTSSAGDASETLETGVRLGSYEILSPIGAGGMGAVYRARDLKLDRDVALKVLPQALASDPAARARFEREAKAVAALSHANILAIFDFGVHDGITYAVMELLEGQTLRGKIEAGPVPERQALDLALQVARGLSAAHEKGIVHRDLKPENIFVTKDSQVKILDFGLSKHVGETELEGKSVPTDSEHTQPGTVMGTVGYMSPEQARGQPVDGRADIFSLGAILYELFSGRKAFKRETPARTIAAILDEEPAALSRAGKDISSAGGIIVRRCLTKDPEGRFQTAREVTIALAEASGRSAANGAQTSRPRSRRRRAMIVVAGALSIGIAVLVVREVHASRGETAGIKRVAVLPFENLGSPDHAYLADGIVDAVRGKLASVPGLQVLTRESSEPYRQTTKVPTQIARELEAGYLLTGTVRWEADAVGRNTLQVNPKLVEVSGSGAPTVRWQKPFDAPGTDILEVQSRIASEVAGSLGVDRATLAAKSLEERPTVNFAAYDAFLFAERSCRPVTVNDVGALERCLDLYERAARLDPRFPEAWAAIAVKSALLYYNGVSAPAMLERAERAAEKATEVGPDRPDGYLARSLNEQLLRHDLDRAIAICAEGRRHWPADAQLLNQMANLEVSAGRWEDAVRHYREARTFDPRLDGSLGESLVCLRRYPEARAAIEHASGISPLNLQFIEDQVNIFLAQGDLARARGVLRRATVEIAPEALVAFVANEPYNFDTTWVLDGRQRDILLNLAPGAFGDDRGHWGLALAVASALKGDAPKTRAYAEAASKSFKTQIDAQPDNPNRERLHAALGLALAYLGRKEEAIREGEEATSIMPVSRDAWEGVIVLSNLVQIYLVVGENEKALDLLDRVMKLPGLWSPGWLRIDPDFDPLRKNPKFQTLIAGK